MIFIKKVILILLPGLFIGFFSTAHPALEYPTGGEHFQPGESVTIQWYIAIEHEQEDWDLYFSPDGGLTWETIVLNLSKNELKYTWVVPDLKTDNGLIRVVMDNIEGITDYDDISGEFSIEGSGNVTGLQDNNTGTFDLENSPNPFSSETQIKFKVKKYSHVTLSIYNYEGSMIATLVDRSLPPGSYEFEWNGSNHRSGLYLCRFITPEVTKFSRMLLLH
jgi:hypothetical protein